MGYKGLLFKWYIDMPFELLKFILLVIYMYKKKTECLYVKEEKWIPNFILRQFYGYNF